MMNDVPLVGSLATGYGDGTIATPSVKTPNLKEASQQFVSMLYAYMFTQMRENGSDEEDGLFSGDHANMMMGFLDQEIGKKMAGSEGAGLASALERQLQQQQSQAAGAEGTDGAQGDAALTAIKGSQMIPSLTGTDATLRSLQKVGALGDDNPDAAADDSMMSLSPASGAMVQPLMAVGINQPLTLGDMDQPLNMDDSENDSSQQMMDELYKLNLR